MAQSLTATRRRQRREEAKAWDRLDDHALTRLFDTGRLVRIRLRRPIPRTVGIALDQATINAIKRIARRKQTDVRHLVAIWIAERLARERADGRPRRMA